MDDDDNDDDQQEEQRPRKEPSSECNSCEHKKGPILIKPKISKPSQENGSKQVKGPGGRTCWYCGKEFNNWSALGGHIRIHTQEGKLRGGGRGRGGGTSSWKLKKKIVGVELGSAEKEDAIGNGEEQLPLHTCYICDKRFPTYKSLMGHMTWHSGRRWRRRSKGDEEEEEEDGDNELFSEVDLLKDLQGWSRTDKRGRIKLDSLEAWGVCGLMKLARATAGLSSADDGGGDHIPSLKNKDGDEIRRWSKKDFKIPEVEDPSKIGSSVRPVICEKKASDRLGFRCTSCHKMLPTFQALVSHGSIHNKDGGIITHPSKISPCPDKKIIAGNAVKEEQDSLRAGNLCETNHEKSTVLHVGPSDQDLLPPVDEARVNGPRSVLQTDLNEIPLVDDDDDDHDDGAFDFRSRS